MIIVFISAITILIVIAMVIIAIEMFFTFRDPCAASVVYDFCVPIKKNKLDGISDKDTVIDEMICINNEEPFIYRQAFLLSFIQALLMTNFLYVAIKDFKLRNFFYIFFMCFLFNSFVYAFVQYHYYGQKNQIMKYGLTKLKTM
jgi:hypothetical protein